MRFLFVPLLFLTCRLASAQTLTVSGEVTKPLTLDAAQFAALPHREVIATDRDGQEHRYAGVPLVDVLRQAGVTLGADLRGENLTKYLLVKAADGYQVLFALPELDPLFATRTILVADRVDGQPLPAGVGPYRLVVPGEKRPARWIREVRSLEVRFAN
jgi:DMSO/TMAO reductase YedYZ molybdopterin-dependent catalytic subunit